MPHNFASLEDLRRKMEIKYLLFRPIYWGEVVLSGTLKNFFHKYLNLPNWQTLKKRLHVSLFHLHSLLNILEFFFIFTSLKVWKIKYFNFILMKWNQHGEGIGWFSKNSEQEVYDVLNKIQNSKGLYLFVFSGIFILKFRKITLGGPLTPVCIYEFKACHVSTI